MKIDQAGIDLIKRFEGYSARVYTDIAGKSTIGTGHLIAPPETPGDYAAGITQEQGDALLLRDLEGVEQAVNSVIPADCTQNQYNVLCSFAFNLGVTNMRVMVSHGWLAIPDQIPRWNRAGGKYSHGLDERRQREAELFTS